MHTLTLMHSKLHPQAQPAHLNAWTKPQRKKPAERCTAGPRPGCWASPNHSITWLLPAPASAAQDAAAWNAPLLSCGHRMRCAMATQYAAVAHCGGVMHITGESSPARAREASAELRSGCVYICENRVAGMQGASNPAHCSASASAPLNRPTPHSCVHNTATHLCSAVGMGQACFMCGEVRQLRRWQPVAPHCKGSHPHEASIG